MCTAASAFSLSAYRSSRANCKSLSNAKSFILTTVATRLRCVHPLYGPVRVCTASAKLCVEQLGPKHKVTEILELMFHLESFMRPASPLAVKWMSVLSILLAVFALANFASAQSETASKRKLSQHTLQQQPVAAKTQAAKSNAPPPATTDTWTGGGGSNTNWSDASNWNNGAITSGENIAISTTTASTVVDQAFTIGTLTLSNTGDTA